jgi:hypothetical protein
MCHSVVGKHPTYPIYAHGLTTQESCTSSMQRACWHGLPQKFASVKVRENRSSAYVMELTPSEQCDEVSVIRFLLSCSSSVANGESG